MIKSKTFFSVILTVVLAISFIGSSKALAQDIYVGDYVDGSQIWMMTETVQKKNMRTFKVRVKSVRNGKLVRHIDYSFWGGVSAERKGYIENFENSDGRKGETNAQGLDEWSAVEHNIYAEYFKIWSEYVLNATPKSRHSS